MQRTPAALERVAEAHAPMMQETFERMANFDASFRAGVTKRLLADGAPEAEIEKLFRLIKEGKMTAEPTNDYLLMQALQMIETIEGELSAMHWTFLSVANGAPKLIIGDHPVMLADPVTSGPIGMRNRDLELLLPLSPTLVACARRDGPDSYGKLTPEMSEIINERTLRYSRRFVFAESDSNELLRDAIRLRGTGPSTRTRRIPMGKGLMIVAEFGYWDTNE
jgi:hypothetical protein